MKIQNTTKDLEMKKNEIEVIDKGIEKGNLQSTHCCAGPYMALR